MALKHSTTGIIAWVRRQTQRMLGVVAATLLVATSLILASPSNEAHADQSSTNEIVRGVQTWYLWLDAGERPYINFTEVDPEWGQNTAWGPDTDIVIRNPNNAVVETMSFTYGAPLTSETFEPATEQTAGVWSITVANPDPGNTQALGSVGFSWEIGAREVGSNTTISGRVWTERYVVKDVLNKPVDLSLWYVTESGFVYRIDREGMTGIDSAFTADAFGVVVRETCVSAYSSFDTYLNDSGFANPRVCPDYTPYKIFFSSPDDDLPESVTLPNGTTTWLMAPTPTVADADVTDLAFTADAPGSRSGEITFSIGNTYEGNATVQIDVDNDGNYAGPQDREAQVRVVSGSASWDFDGKDADGNLLPVTMPISVRVHVDRMGEVHFGDEDVEMMTGGVVVTREGDAFGDENRVYWDDSIFEGASNDARCSTVSATTSGPSGVISGGVTGGVHSWDLGTCQTTDATLPTFFNFAPNQGVLGGTYGNLRYIDRWSYVTVDQQRLLEVPGFELEKTSDPATGSAVEAGDEVSYSVTASPIRYAHVDSYDTTGATPDLPATTWSGRYTDNLSDVADNATIDWDSVSTNPTTGNSVQTSPADNLYTWTGTAVPIGSSVTTNYNATVAPQKTDGDYYLHNIAYSHTSETPPGVPTECVAGVCGQTEHWIGDLTVTKSSDPESGTTVVAGQRISYTLTFTNRGQADVPVDYTDYLEGVLDDADIVGEPVVSPSDSLTATRNGDRIDIDGTLSAESTATVTYSVKAKADSTGDLSLLNIVREGDTAPPAECVVTDPLCTEHPLGTAALELVKSVKSVDDTNGDSLTNAGDLVTYEFVTTNTGTATLENVVVEESEFSGTGELSALSCDPSAPSTLEPGQKMTCIATYTLTQEDEDATKVTNVAFSQGEVPGVDDSGNPIKVVTPPDDAEVLLESAGATPTNPESPLAQTGTTVAWLVLLGAVLVTAGGITLAVRRKRGPKD